MANIYSRLGVRTLINATGTLTRLGGSRMHPTVTAAMAEAARSFVSLDELQARAGEHIARLLGVEAAYISAGAAAGLTLATAACVAGEDAEAIARLPDTRGLRNRVAIHKSQRNGYDQAVRLVGVEIAEFGEPDAVRPEQLEAVLDEHTAAVVYFAHCSGPASLPLGTVLDIAHCHGVPVIVDAAAEVPPIENLRYFLEQGADLAVYSGGKAIAGPQSSGLVLGRADLIRACAANACPHHAIGRPMKVGKEEIVGLLVALERFLALDPAAEEARWEGMVAYWVETLGAVPGLHVRRVCPVPPGIQPNTIPRAYVEWDEAALGLSVEEALQRLRQGEPAVAAGSAPGALVLNPQVLEPGEEQIVAERIRALF